jgi:rare lipoprotein A
MTRKRLLFAVMTTCTVLILSYAPAGASRWDSSRGQIGLASWYGGRFHGRETASGERFSVKQLTAAHRDLPLGTKVLVMNLETTELVEVKINDRGPVPKRRIIDLSRAAADTIGLLHRGVGQVRVVVSEGALELRDANDEVFYEVQVGAFVDVEQANELLNQLQSHHPAAYVATRNGPLGNYHRVRIGPFEARQEAQGALRSLIQGGYYAFLDEVAASSLLGRLRMPDEKGPSEPEPGGLYLDGPEVQEGVAAHSEAEALSPPNTALPARETVPAEYPTSAKLECESPRGQKPLSQACLARWVMSQP